MSTPFTTAPPPLPAETVGIHPTPGAVHLSIPCPSGRVSVTFESGEEMADFREALRQADIEAERLLVAWGEGR